MRRLLLLLGLGLGLSAEATPMRWADIRDGSLYLQPDRPDTVTVQWVPAWQADANEEHLYLLDGQGKLQAERLIAASESRGSQSWPLAPSAASYRLEVPGYSFRRYTVEHDDHTVALFAPAKVHFSAETRDGDELFFKVPAGERAVLAGKFHGGVGAFQAQRVGDGKQLSLALKPYPQYWEFDQVELPVASTDQVWRLRLRGSGKAAFWLDGTANLFAQNPQQLKPLREDPGQTRLMLHKEILGKAANLGMALPYALPSANPLALLKSLNPRAASYYSVVDIMASRPHYEDAFRRLYQDRLGIRQDITLLAGSQRKADLQADATSNAGLDAWLAATRALGDEGTHYIGFADEPNLNYPDYASYQRLFISMARQVRSNPDNFKAGVRIAMPASTRLVNGPFADNATDKRGIDWARRLLAESGDSIDALAWHEWMIRDLLATRVYRDNVAAPPISSGSMRRVGHVKPCCWTRPTYPAVQPSARTSRKPITRRYGGLRWPSTRPRTACSTCSTGFRPMTNRITARACCASSAVITTNSNPWASLSNSFRNTGCETWCAWRTTPLKSMSWRWPLTGNAACLA